MSAHLFTLSSTNLVKLGLSAAGRTVTRMGSKCLAKDMDIRGILLVEVGTKLGVEIYAKIAAAFIASGNDLFSNPHPGIQQPTSLTDEQLALASEYGDIHTAVKWYLEWCRNESLPEDQESCLNHMCFRKMHSYLHSKRRAFDVVPAATGYEMRLCVAIGFVYQKNVVCQHGNRLVTCHIDVDLRRKDGHTPLEFLNQDVMISQRSVCYTE